MTYGDWVRACLVLAGLGAVVALPVAVATATGKGLLGALGTRQPVVVVMVGRDGAPTTYQPPQPHRWGFGRWYGLFAAVFAGLPLLGLVLLTVARAQAWLMGHWWVLLVGGVVVSLVFGGWWLFRSDRPVRPEPVPVKVPAEPVPATAVDQHRSGWVLSPEQRAMWDETVTR